MQLLSKISQEQDNQTCCKKKSQIRLRSGSDLSKKEMTAIRQEGHLVGRRCRGSDIWKQLIMGARIVAKVMSLISGLHIPFPAKLHIAKRERTRAKWRINGLQRNSNAMAEKANATRTTQRDVTSGWARAMRGEQEEMLLRLISAFYLREHSREFCQIRIRIYIILTMKIKRKQRRPFVWANHTMCMRSRLI